MTEQHFLPSIEYANEIWARVVDPDAYPGETEDRIAKDYDWASELVFQAYVEGRLVEAKP